MYFVYPSLYMRALGVVGFSVLFVFSINPCEALNV